MLCHCAASLLHAVGVMMYSDSWTPCLFCLCVSHALVRLPENEEDSLSMLVVLLIECPMCRRWLSAPALDTRNKRQERDVLVIVLLGFLRVFVDCEGFGGKLNMM